ncbi:hypothetical protein A6A08_05465 [Nocardiopsis sp. TSRI0078]|uniref:hypothetical protein n=1 Tax=unclassified Nocardiopsis TaxID=2649073 RepID=UPI0009391BA2|nr:hypothetical protein [Nocardiopsis sp. TSRI0078]OKI19044.1 hypothetical protein A6A08_05465 [Nocardiopsis sp. TSRI0078]
MLFAAPVAAVAATLLLTALTGQIPQVLTWGALMTLVAAAPIVVPPPHRRTAIRVCAALLAAATVLGILSVGAFYVPALAALVIAGTTHRPKSRGRRSTAA